jgi:hypothetical protein
MMDQAMNEAVSQIVNDMSPPAGSVGMLTRDDVREIIERAATQGALAGWLVGMRTARNAYEKKPKKDRND